MGTSYIRSLKTVIWMLGFLKMRRREHALHGSIGNILLLMWRRHYFHHECHHQILHLDIKPANVLLDSNYRALVSDSGISKLIGKDESTVTTRARGTVILTVTTFKEI
jgi:serine/threonine protein kinase